MDNPDPELLSNRLSGFKIALVMSGLVLLIALLSGRISHSSASAGTEPASSSQTYSALKNSGTPRADALTSSTGAYMDEREKQLYERDPTSMGYTDADRQFLQDHGVTEGEARAAETVLHDQGIDD
jgi:hypothetical protein